MAELDRSVSELDLSTAVPVGSLFFLSVEDQQSSSGYASKKISSENVANQFLTAYSILTLNTDSKNVVGAINEVKGKELIGTLTAGQTTLTITDAAILTTSTIDIYVDVYGINPEDVQVVAGSITMTFPVQAANLGVKVVIR